MTWKEFKDRVEALGVTDETLIYYIDVNVTDADSIEVSDPHPDDATLGRCIH